MEMSDKLRGQLGTWADVLEPFVKTKKWDDIFVLLRAIHKEKKVVMPKSGDVFKSFELCDRKRVKAIVMLQCPYATMRHGVMVASGVPMSCENVHPYQQPSLFMWHQAIEQQYGFDPDIEERSDISYLLEEESVLLINSALTVEKDKPDSHATLWEPLMKYLFQEIINKQMCGLPIVLVGNSAQQYERYIDGGVHHILKIEHPAAAAYQNRGWHHGGMHKWVNNLIEENNGKQHCIRWTRNKGEVLDKDNKVLQSWLNGEVPNEDELTGDDLPWQKKE